MLIEKISYKSTDSELMQFYTDLREQNIIEKPIKNFSRYDRLSKLCFLTYLSHKDELNLSDIDRPNVGLLLVDENGSLESNMVYYKDYIDCGKTLARGNYFIYTLATSPLAELSIYLGVQGPLQYLCSLRENELFAIEQSKNMIENNEAKSVLAFYKDDKLLKVKLIKEDEQE